MVENNHINLYHIRQIPRMLSLSRSPFFKGYTETYITRTLRSEYTYHAVHVMTLGPLPLTKPTLNESVMISLKKYIKKENLSRN